MNQEREYKALPENRMAALKDLHINPTHQCKRNEAPVFLLYCNYAVNNICDITGIDKELSAPEKVSDAIRKRPGASRKLANFFWMFQAEDPARDFPDYEEKALAIATKIYELRNFFAHLERQGNKPLIVSHELYVFLGGVLASEAMEQVVAPGLRSSKVFKMHLFAQRDKNNWDFTRRGLIFIICMALYRTEAMEFTQCLEDMKLPACPQDENMTVNDCLECQSVARCKQGTAKAFIEFFLHFSVRQGRSVNLLEDDLNYLSFADLLGYLNKVPAESYSYLQLSKERNFLQELSESSTEIEENKEFKYALHKRFRNRFLSFAAAYCEDFALYPALKFKRLDISETEGRKRYFFGSGHDNRVRMDRHFQIQDDAIRFAYEPEKHYGAIHIDSLRSAVSATAMKELLYARIQEGGHADDIVEGYFASYHRMLERIVNAVNPADGMLLDQVMLEDLAVIAGKSVKAIEDNPMILDGVLPKNLLRFFTGKDSAPDMTELRNELQTRLENLGQRADDFQTRLHKLQSWRQQLRQLREKDPQATLPRPECSAQEVANPPRSCSVSDGALIGWVFRYFNLFLNDDEKFRQLPRGKQHREGIKDFEYQMVHAMIGKYALDPKGLEFYLSRQRAKLYESCWEQLNRKIKFLRNKAEESRPKEFDKWGRPERHPATLEMLGEAAAWCYRQYIDDVLSKLASNSNASAENLKKICKKFGVKTGLSMDRGGMLKTILHIDLAKWLHAFNPELGKNYESRSLDQTGHTVSQIPFPNDFAQRIMLASHNPQLQKYVLPDADGISRFHFNEALRDFQTPLDLRDYYDATPLLEAFYTLKKGQSLCSIGELKLTPEERETPADWTKNGVNRALRAIKNVHNQDKLLAFIANRYWEKFQAQGSFGCDWKKNKAILPQGRRSVYQSFDASVKLAFSQADKRQIVIHPNDVNRPVLSQVRTNAATIAKRMNPQGNQQEFDFYRMQETYRQILQEDRRKRFEIIPLLMRLEQSVIVPEGKITQEMSSSEKQSIEFPYYQKKYPTLTWEHFRKIVTTRNQVYHRGLGLDVEEAVGLLKQLPLPAELRAPWRPPYQRAGQYGSHGTQVRDNGRYKSTGNRSPYKH